MSKKLNHKTSKFLSFIFMDWKTVDDLSFYGALGDVVKTNPSSEELYRACGQYASTCMTSKQSIRYIKRRIKRREPGFT